MRDWLVVIALFTVLGVLTVTSALYAKDAERESHKINEKLEQINITSQNRCIIKVVLSYPAPISQEQFDVVLGDYDKCILEETGE